MTSIQIRDIPEEVHDELVRRAHDNRQSLQQYMRALIIREANQPSMAAIMARAGERARRRGTEYSFDDIVADVRDMREIGH